MADVSCHRFPPSGELPISRKRSWLILLLKRLFYREVWTVGIIPYPAEAIVRGTPIVEPEWLGSPRGGRFHADPFLVDVEGRTHVMFETWSRWRGRGWIEVAPVEGCDLASASVAIDRGCHMSYPSIITIDGQTFCVPETWEAGVVWLYRMGLTARDWTPAAHFLADLPIVDPTIFQHDGHWWLLATMRGARPEEDLYAWYSDSPIKGWTPHPLNPIKSDIGTARPAGTVFRIGADLYRPAQDCSSGYGAGLVIHRITRLDPTGFEEVIVRRLKPDPTWAFPDGLHTINSHYGQTAIDAKRMVFDPFGPIWMLVPHLRRLFRQQR